MVKKKQAQVWLGSYASIWAHRGYSLIGSSTVVCDPDEVTEILARTFPETLVERDGHYYYSDADADADLDGSSAIAVVTLD